MARNDLTRSCLACQPEFDALVAASPEVARRWAALPRRRFEPGDALLRQGETAAAVWMVQRGLVRCYYLGEDGTERNRSFQAEGAWVGCGAPPRPSTSPFTIEALEATDVVEMSYAELATCLADVPGARAVLDDGIGSLLSRQATREAELLLLDATQRYQAFLQEYDDLAPRIPLHHVASYLGITNVALSRIRARLGMVAAR